MAFSVFEERATSIEDAVDDQTPFLARRRDRPFILIGIEPAKRIYARWLRGLARLGLPLLHSGRRRRIKAALAAAASERKRQQRRSDERDLSGAFDQMHAKRPQIFTASHPYKARRAMARP
jgi:hypothetical protein